MNVLKQIILMVAVGIPAYSYTMEHETYKKQLRLAYQRCDKAEVESRLAKAELINLREGWRNKINQLQKQQQEEYLNLIQPYLKVEEEIYDEQRRLAKL